MEKHLQYAALIASQIQEMFDRNSENFIDLDELAEEENIKAFFYALSTIVPCQMWNKVVEDQRDHLTFNHTMNHLIFENANLKKGKWMHVEYKAPAKKRQTYRLFTLPLIPRLP